MAIRIAVFSLLLSAALTGPVLAQDAAACPGTLSHLLEWAGSYDDRQVLGDELVTANLARLLGPHLDHLHENLSVRGSIDLIACELVITGNADHRGGEEAAIVSISLGTGRVSAAILSAGVMNVFVDGAEYFSVPLSIRDWLAVASTGFTNRFELPVNARQLPAQGA